MSGKGIFETLRHPSGIDMHNYDESQSHILTNISNNGFTGTWTPPMESDDHIWIVELRNVGTALEPRLHAKPTLYESALRWSKVFAVYKRIQSPYNYLLITIAPMVILLQ
jgi:hypothetical protein